MAHHHEMQASRYELKYIIDEYRAAAIRDFLRSHLVADEYADPVTASYTIHSLYLDSPSLTLYRTTVTGLKNRFKLRIRFYDDDPSHPAFLEIKRRLNDVICKERAAISRQGARQLLQYPWPDPMYLLDKRPKAREAYFNFCRSCRDMGALGCVYVSYEREAYVSPDSDDLRVTFDRHIRSARHEPFTGIAPPAQSVLAPVKGVVLEIKFTNRFPQWLHNLVLAFDLMRCPMAKYVNCVQTIGERELVVSLAGKVAS